MKYLEEIFNIFYSGITEIGNLLSVFVGYVYFITRNYGKQDIISYDPEHNNIPQLNRINWYMYRNLNRYNKKIDFKSISYLIFISIIIFILVKFSNNIYDFVNLIADLIKK
jgi:hypothetical protein